MKVSEAFDSVIPSQLVTRMKELVRQSREYRQMMEDINREMVLLNEEIAKLKSKPDQKDS